MDVFHNSFNSYIYTPSRRLSSNMQKQSRGCIAIQRAESGAKMQIEFSRR